MGIAIPDGEGKREGCNRLVSKVGFKQISANGTVSRDNEDVGSTVSRGSIDRGSAVVWSSAALAPAGQGEILQTTAPGEL